MESKVCTKCRFVTFSNDYVFECSHFHCPQCLVARESELHEKLKCYTCGAKITSEAVEVWRAMREDIEESKSMQKQIFDELYSSPIFTDYIEIHSRELVKKIDHKDIKKITKMIENVSTSKYLKICMYKDLEKLIERHYKELSIYSAGHDDTTEVFDKIKQIIMENFLSCIDNIFRINVLESVSNKLG